MRNAGFTLIELMIATGIFALLSVALYAAVTSTVEATDSATAEGDVVQGLRDVMREITREVQVAAAQNDPTLADPLFGLTVDDVGGLPAGITFQTPIDNSGENWSEPISYVWVNEDADGDARLDGGEDDNNDGALTRVIMRREDLNNDGDTTDPSEWRRVPGSNNISNAQFAFDGTVLTVTLTASKRPNQNRDQAITATLTSNVYLMN